MVDVGDPRPRAVQKTLQELLVPGNVVERPGCMPSDNMLQELRESCCGFAALVSVLHVGNVVAGLDNCCDGEDEQSPLFPGPPEHFVDHFISILVMKRHSGDVAHHGRVHEEDALH